MSKSSSSGARAVIYLGLYAALASLATVVLANARGGFQVGSAVISAPTMWIAIAALTIAIVGTGIDVRRLRRRVQAEHGAKVQAEHALRKTSDLEAITAALSKAQTSSEVTHACLAELLHSLGAAAGAVALVSDISQTGRDGAPLEIVRAMGYGERQDDTSPASLSLDSRTIETEALRRHDTIAFTSRADRQRRLPEINDAAPLGGREAAVAVPLVVAGHAVGVVSLRFDRPRELAAEERELLTAVARRTAQAIDRARRYEVAERARADAEAFRARADTELRERQRAEEALRESEARYRALAARTTRLYTLSAGLSEAVTLDAVATVIVRQGKIVVGALAGSVALLTDNGEFETLYAEEDPHELVEGWRRFAAEPGLCSTAAVTTRQPVLVGSFAEWQQQYPRSASMAADGGYASTAALPLLVEGSAIGVLSFHFTAPVNFDDDYRALLTSVTQHAAQAVDRARLYEAAQRARADAEAANREKDDFLSTVSHELRTPLSAMLGWAAMLRDQTLDASRTQRAIEAIYNNATRQARLIDELLDVSRIIAGRTSLDLQDVDLTANLRGAVEAIMPLAEAKGLQLRVEPFPSAAQVVADPHRLEQIFLNLLGNAVKFTPSGGRVTVEIVAGERSFDVRFVDTGRGIDAAFLPHVFERFRQAEGSVARSVGGLGLGLFITHRLVDAHGGRIRVDSEGEGRGSTFTVTLPAAVEATFRTPSARDVREQSQQLTETLPSLAGVSVLVVDDEPDVREMMTSVLETCGARVVSAPSTEDALETLTHRSNIRDPIDVLLADIAMPGKDGYELIREVREQPLTSISTVPAAAVTACARADERERALAAGFQMHLAKPLRPDVLAQAVAALAHVETAANRAS